MNEDANRQDKLADLEALLEISKAMAVEKDLSRLLDLIIERTTTVMRAERTSLFLVDRQTGELCTRTAEGLEIKEIRLPVGQGISGTVAVTKELINIDAPYGDSRFDPSWDKKTGFHTRSILCVPLVTHEDKVVGVVQVLNKKGGAFTSYDENLLLALAGHAAIALDQAELVEHYVQKKQMAAALAMARDIQAQVLPEESPLVEGLDIYGHCWPCDETGGDYYDFIPMEDGRIGVAIGDVTGHGVGSALLMMGSRSLLRALATFQSDLQQTAERMNALLCEDVKDGMFLTMFCAAIDPATRALSYVSAGHEPPLLVRAATREVAPLENYAPPMGILDDVKLPESPPVVLDPGDLLFLFTDGATEREDAAGEHMLGSSGVKELLLENLDKSAEDIVGTVKDAVMRFGGHKPRKDDLTLVAVKACD